VGKVGKILLAVVTVGAIIALNVFVPGSGLAASVGGLFGASAAVGSAIIIGIGTLAITLVSAYLNSALFGKKIDYGKQKVNVRLEDATRWLLAGPVLQGGACVFADHDAQGNLWAVLVHGDSILNGAPQYYLDNILVTVDGSGQVTTPDFKTDDGDVLWTLKTYTYTESNPTPPGATTLQAAFPGQWATTSHMLVGTTYTVMRGRATKIKNRYKQYKWRGAVGLGEPNVAIFGTWSKMYDPRDPTQVLGNRSTYKPSSNSALMWAWWRTHPFGRNKPESEVNWQRVAEQATICDETVTGVESTQKRYECAIAAQDNVDRAAIEANIILSCDGQLVFDDDGKSWMRVGKYQTPSLTLGRRRDIISMSSLVAQDGESETQGVIVRYMDHNAAFSIQPSAAWYNPNYYEAGKGNTFLYVDIPTCFNHNQAMRLAKSIGMRSQPLQKIAPTVGLRGVRAMQERFVEIQYDNEFAGDYEIIAPVDVDESGFFCSLNLVPVDANRFDLLSGEEKPRPNSASSTGGGSIDMPSVTSVVYNNGRIEVQFNAPLRDDVTYEFQPIAQSDLATGQWADMNTDMDALFAYSGPVDSYQPQLIRWRTVTAGGSNTAWYDPPYLLDPQVLASVTNLTVTDGTGEVTVSWKNPNDLRFFASDVYRGTASVFGSASKIISNYGGGLGEIQYFNDTIGPGTYYYWIVAKDASGSEAVRTGPEDGVVT